ncbi:ATP dependent RNA helicase DDX52 [Trichuris trichiura]|uniref:Probable ATP-dependent RNA helicase DDX52 n=1 Tax=Trichuris trichiura TaxID=36087 RepID=A0A077ZHP7_TRITR|nr:ATP dependent RNA helicase DDX52 [Trichuris trichiura]
MNRQERLFRLLSFGASRKRQECAVEPSTSLPIEEPTIHSDQAVDKKLKLKDNEKSHLSNEQSLRLFQGSASFLNEEDAKVAKSRRKHNIFVYGEDVPNPCCTFDEICKHLPAELTVNVRKLGFSTPTAIQMQAIPAMLEGRELMANAPTGSGKTLAFVIPALNEILKNKTSQHSCCQVLVIEPTLELARQVRVTSLITPLLVSFSVLDIVVSTPNRLIYSMEAEPSLYDLHEVKWLVIDECDRLFEAGKRGFREQLSKIYQACNNPQTRRALFSATFSYHLEQWCKINLNSLVLVCVGARNSAVGSIEQKLVFVGSEHGKLVALERMFAEGLQPPLLIFVQSRERSEQLHNELREASMKRFRTGEVPILVCSELVGRGIDFKAVNTVVNYDFPISSVSYIHCIGRTGRAGRGGLAITFFTESDTPLLRNIGNIIKAAGCPVPDYILQLPKASKKRLSTSQKLIAEPRNDNPGARSLTGRARKNLMANGHVQELMEQLHRELFSSVQQINVSKLTGKWHRIFDSADVDAKDCNALYATIVHETNLTASVSVKEYYQAAGNSGNIRTTWSSMIKMGPDPADFVVHLGPSDGHRYEFMILSHLFKAPVIVLCRDWLEFHYNYEDNRGQRGRRKKVQDNVDKDLGTTSQTFISTGDLSTLKEESAPSSIHAKVRCLVHFCNRTCIIISVCLSLSWLQCYFFKSE